MNHLATGEDLKTGWRVQLCDRAAIDLYWDDIVGMLKKVPETWLCHTLESLYANAISGTMQVWTVGPSDKVLAVVFTHVLEFPAMRILDVIWLCGEGALEGLDVLDTTVEEFARVQNCSRIDAIGRRGWKGEAEKRGFKESATIFSKDVKHERRH